MDAIKKCHKYVGDYYRTACHRPVVGLGVLSGKPVCGAHAGGEKNAKRSCDRYRERAKGHEKARQAQEELRKHECLTCHRPWKVD